MRRQELRKRPYIVFLIAAAMILCFSLCSCSEVKLKTSGDKDSLLQVEDAVCSSQEAVFMLMEEKALYEQSRNPADFWERQIGSETMSEYVKDVVADRLTRYTAAIVMSDRLAAYPTEDAKLAANEEAAAAWTKISGMYDVDAYGITAEDANELYYKKAVYEAVYTRITNDATMDITEDSTRVMKADYVVVPKGDGEEAAVQIYQSIKAGTGFADACAAAGYPLLTSQVIKRGELNSAVDSVAFALHDGELSEVIESKDGYYIIQCIDDNLLLESAANYNEILTRAKEEAFKEAYFEFSKNAKLAFDSSYWKKIDVGNIR